MGNLQIKDVPNELHAELRRRAEEQGRSVRDYVLDLLRRDQQRPTRQEWLGRVRQLAPTDLGAPVVESLHEDREERDRELRRAGRS